MHFVKKVDLIFQKIFLSQSGLLPSVFQIRKFSESISIPHRVPESTLGVYCVRPVPVYPDLFSSSCSEDIMSLVLVFSCLLGHKNNLEELIPDKMDQNLWEDLGSKHMARTPMMLVTQKGWEDGFEILSMGCVAHLPPGLAPIEDGSL